MRLTRVLSFTRTPSFTRVVRRTRVRSLVAIAGLVASGTVAGFLLAAAPASAVPVTTQVALISYCGDHGTVRPATEDLPGCMPSNEYVSGLKWTSWRSVAYGSGILRVNNCTPSCAQGTYVNYPILTVLWRAEPWPGNAGHHYFSRMTVIFTGSRHPHGPAAQTLTLPAAG
jgi:hypothetical protein